MISLFAPAGFAIRRERVSSYPRALMSSHRARTAVTPWTAYPPSAAPLKPGVLPRITSAITDTIQAAENSQTTTVPIHHHMVASPPFLIYSTCLSLTQEYDTKLSTALPIHWLTVGYPLSLFTPHSYASTSRTVSREALRAGRKLAIAARMRTTASQSRAPLVEKV